MEPTLATTLIDREAGDDGVSRRSFLSHVAVTTTVVATAAPMAASEPAQAAAAPAIKRMQAVPGLAPPGSADKPTYSHVASSTRKKMIFIAGQLARDAKGNTVGKDDARAQMRQVYENLKTALAAEGATLADVVQTNAFITSWEKFREAGDVRAEYVGKNLPTSTAVQVVALAFPEAMFEVNAIAMVDA
jgi:enamine deaminase RidA (YjgF/YER057c/UK114 family)